MSDNSTGGDPRREAGEWMIALQDRPDDAALCHRFSAWRTVPGNAAAWEEVERVSALVRVAARAQAVPRSPGALRWRALAPVSAVACAVALLVGSDFLPRMAADHSTGTAETRVLRLPDGSHVTLAPRSAIALEERAGRHVRLVRGTAFFDVVHDPDNPFRVSTGDARVTALGTAFEVRREGGATYVAVHEGLVRTACNGEWTDPDPLRLGDTQALDCDAGVYSHGHVPPGTVGSWIGGQLIVADRPVSQVVEALRPWHSGLLIARGRGMQRRVTGAYDVRHPDRALSALARAHRLTILRLTPWITVVSAY
jgi:transmembrane sensor